MLNFSRCDRTIVELNEEDMPVVKRKTLHLGGLNLIYYFSVAAAISLLMTVGSKK